jgi:uncharacterized protein (TIGR02452 family)
MVSSIAPFQIPSIPSFPEINANEICDKITSKLEPVLTPVENWAKQNSQLATITTIAFAILGIAFQLGSVILLSTAAEGLILGLVAFGCFAAASATGYSLVRQAIATFRPQAENIQGSPPNIPLNDEAAQKNYHVQVMNDTWNHLNAGFYTSPNGNMQRLDLSSAIEGMELLTDAGEVGVRPGNERTHVSVKNQDCLYVAAELHVKGLNPIVLDITNNRAFGGEYRAGGRGPEEDCCRRTGLSTAIIPHHDQLYPLNDNSRPTAGIYVPNVPVFRAGYDKGYQYLNHPFEVAFGMIAPFRNPDLNVRGRMHDQTSETTKEKIRTFFEMAYQHGHQSVVFGAFGCISHGNPPEQIADITMQVINEEFSHCFKEVVIAIPIEQIDEQQSQNAQNSFRIFARAALEAQERIMGLNGQPPIN